ncbi:MAG: long-chain-fatty-acid--CoA ligase [Candidatus Obscuribacterales bacterium]|jgi:acyl-CoA synthetase (AMP-forming)/AMP-acid ligase II|nr:long-chain-fatty-acid--CoA ligase [Candidatus Obscuribacterales bacterium]
MNLWLSLNKALTLFPEREALVDGPRRFTYRQFGERVASLLQFLRSIGLKKGSVAAISCPNTAEFMEVYYACGIEGIILVPLNYRLASEELSEIINDAGAELLFFHSQFSECAKEILPNCPEVKHLVLIGDGNIETTASLQKHKYETLCQNKSARFDRIPYLSADDLAHLYYTSGTTGRPKGVMLSHGNVMFNALGAIAELRLCDADTWIHAAPLFHLADAWATFAITWVGGKHVFLAQFNSRETLKKISEEKVTLTVLVPTMLNAMVNDPDVADFGYDSLRMLITGGSPIAPEVVKRVMKTFGCEYVQLYGMTETSPFLTVSCPKSEHKDLHEDKQVEIRAKTGRPYIGAEVKVVRPDGEEVECNGLEVGEIIARGPTITRGYWKQPEATAQAIKDGWIHTGDLAVVDDHGYINIVDRKKDMIISGGENVYSTEVEYALYEHTGVAECAVFGIPDERWGESVHAVVVRKPGNENLSEEDLIAFVKDRLAKYKAPRSIEFMTELPKTGSGKIYKKEMREKYWSGRVKQVN